MIDINKLRRLAQAVSGWGNCNQAWLDHSEDTPAAVVGYIDEDGNTYPAATIDCDQYYAAHQSLPLAKFYAAANPVAISELLDRLEAAERVRDELRTELNEIRYGAAVAHDTIKALRAKIEQMEKQEPVGEVVHNGESAGLYDILEPGAPIYALPGAQAQSAPSVPDGWKLVPIVSTDEMDNAGSDHCDGYLSTAQAVWDAMLAAAPEAKS